MSGPLYMMAGNKGIDTRVILWSSLRCNGSSTGEVEYAVSSRRCYWQREVLVTFPNSAILVLKDVSGSEFGD